jgi:hypothetical protein
MDEIPGTKLRAKTVKQGHPVDCRDWQEFAILEVKYDGIRVRYREFDTLPASDIESATARPGSMPANT